MAFPSEFNADDDIEWTEGADSATAIVYHFQQNLGGGSFSVSASISADVATFTLAGTTTASIPAGSYRAWRKKTVAGSSTTADAGTLLLRPNPAGVPDAAKSHAQTCAELLAAHIEGRLPTGLEAHTIDGQSIGKITLLDARRLLKEYRRQWKAETAAASGSTEKPSGVISYTFQRP